MFIYQWLMNLIAGPVVNGLLAGYKLKLQSETDRDKIAGDLAARELAVQNTEIMAQNQLKIAEIGHAWEPEKLAFYITLAYYGKIVIWDVLLGLGSTDALHGQVASWAQMIMAFYFGKRTFENVARIWKRN